MEKVKAILIDLDGTLANVDHRLKFVRSAPKNWDRFHQELVNDSVNEWCNEIIKSFTERGYKILLLTGRPDQYRKETKKWLLAQQIEYEQLYMRKSKDFRDDQVVKREVYEQELVDKYDILLVIEDRLKVVRMWREIGLTCLQCEWGDF